MTTRDGYLELRMDAHVTHDLAYRSGMIQSWNLLCFKGGHIEVSVQLPGSGAISGLWYVEICDRYRTLLTNV